MQQKTLFFSESRLTWHALLDVFLPDCHRDRVEHLRPPHSPLDARLPHAAHHHRGGDNTLGHRVHEALGEIEEFLES